MKKILLSIVCMTSLIHITAVYSMAEKVGKLTAAQQAQLGKWAGLAEATFNKAGYAGKFGVTKADYEAWLESKGAPPTTTTKKEPTVTKKTAAIPPVSATPLAAEFKGEKDAVAGAYAAAVGAINQRWEGPENKATRVNAIKELNAIFNAPAA